MGEEKDKMNQNKVSISDTDNNDDDTGKTHSNRETTSAQLSNKEGEPVEKRDRGRPRKPAQIVIGEKVEEDVFHTPIVQSAFSYSPKEVRKHKDKSKSKTTRHHLRFEAGRSFKFAIELASPSSHLRDCVTFSLNMVFMDMIKTK